MTGVFTECACFERCHSLEMCSSGKLPSSSCVLTLLRLRARAEVTLQWKKDTTTLRELCSMTHATSELKFCCYTSGELILEVDQSESMNLLVAFPKYYKSDF